MENDFFKMGVVTNELIHFCFQIFLALDTSLVGNMIVRDFPFYFHLHENIEWATVRAIS